MACEVWLVAPSGSDSCAVAATSPDPCAALSVFPGGSFVLGWQLPDWCHVPAQDCSGFQVNI